MNIAWRIESVRKSLPNFMWRFDIRETADRLIEVGEFPATAYPDARWIAYMMVATGDILPGEYGEVVDLIIQVNNLWPEFQVWTTRFSETEAKHLVDFALALNNWPWNDDGLRVQSVVNRRKHIAAGATIVDIDWMLRGGVVTLSDLELALATLSVPNVTSPVIPLVVSETGAIDINDCALRRYLVGDMSLGKIMREYNRR